MVQARHSDCSRYMVQGTSLMARLKPKVKGSTVLIHASQKLEQKLKALNARARMLFTLPVELTGGTFSWPKSQFSAVYYVMPQWRCNCKPHGNFKVWARCARSLRGCAISVSQLAETVMSCRLYSCENFYFKSLPDCGLGTPIQDLDRTPLVVTKSYVPALNEVETSESIRITASAGARHSPKFRSIDLKSQRSLLQLVESRTSGPPQRCLPKFME